jgi:serine protease
VRKLSILLVLGAVALLFGGTVARADSDQYFLHHYPMYMKAANTSQKADSLLQPPPVNTGGVCVGSVGLCVLPPPPAGEPAPINMGYFGGHVQVAPKVYLVLWGWGQPGAFNHATPGMPTSDPDGAGARMLAFIKAMGGTAWMGSQTQYYETDAAGNKTYITNPTNQYGGVWYDNTNPIHNNVTGLELAQEAQRAVAHFGVTDLKNSQFVIAQPQMFNEQGFNEGVGYCAWHDYTQPQYYPGVQAGISFTNMPYVLNSGTGCGENSVNTGYFAGRLDGFTIVMGHEIEETITDPGAEDVINGQNLGGWYDYSGYENGDKCAWVGYSEGIAAPSAIPGGLNNITGNDGKKYPVQSLWSNNAAGGTGWCAGAEDDLPTG